MRREKTDDRRRIRKIMTIHKIILPTITAGRKKPVPVPPYVRDMNKERSANPIGTATTELQRIINRHCKKTIWYSLLPVAPTAINMAMLFL
ncbi:hypothetical protein J19TS2_23480 [Cohnella xylanilytica]|nr:hypothetical protein J19TS2_23480 [Cohnella xylanilytica]